MSRVRSSALPNLFLPSALLVIGACFLVLRSQAFAERPDVLAWAVTFDLTLTVPLLYWLLVVRTGRARAMTVVPVFLVAMMLAAALVPRPQQAFLADLQMLAIPLELLVAGAIVQRIRRAARERSTSTDPYVRIGNAARVLFGEGRVAEIVASEITILYYALFTWRRQPEATRGRVITVHERSGWPTVVVCILVLLVAESIGLHLLIQMWSVTAAWIFTGLDVWGMLWLLGDLQALKLRRSAITDDAFELRYGLRWSAIVPRTNIASIDEVRQERDWKQRDILKVAMLDEPRWLITLREPMQIRGMAGLRKTIRAIAILPDDEEALLTLRRDLSPSGECAVLP